MRRVILLLLILFAFQSISAQNPTEAYKLGEYDRNDGSGCGEYFRIADMLEEVKNQEGSKGLIVIYSGNDEQRFGNILAYISGTKNYIKYFLKTSPEKVSFIIAKGKNLFNEEFWIIPQNAKLPDIKSDSFDFRNLKNKYHFSHTCPACEPNYPRLTSFQENLEDYAEILKKYNDYRGLIEISYEGGTRAKDYLKQARKYAANYRQQLTKDYGIENNRITIKISKSLEKDTITTANLFIIPAIKR